MRFSHLFYKDIPLDEANIFFGQSYRKQQGRKNQLKKKSKLYAIGGLSIDQDITPNVSLPNVEGKKSPQQTLQTHAEEKNIFNLDLKIYKEDYVDITVPFVKTIDVLIN